MGTCPALPGSSRPALNSRASRGAQTPRRRAKTADRRKAHHLSGMRWSIPEGPSRAVAEQPVRPGRTSLAVRSRLPGAKGSARLPPLAVYISPGVHKPLELIGESGHFQGEARAWTR